MEQESATTEKQHLEKRLQDESLGLHTSYSDLEVSQLKAEIEVGAVPLCHLALISFDVTFDRNFIPNFIPETKEPHVPCRC